MTGAQNLARLSVPGQGDQPVALIVDDDPIARSLAEAALDTVGFDSHEAENGREAIELFERVRPDFVLLDIMMPEMDGFEVCEALRAREDGATTPIVVMTSLDDSASVQRAYDLGATDFIIKPVNGALLAHRASYVLRTHRHHVQYDDLTGLPKRDLFLQEFGTELARARRHGRKAAMMMLGLDGFERINTSFGHLVGDRLLREYAYRLTTILRTEDLTGHRQSGTSNNTEGVIHDATIARLGGDEFAVALVDIHSAKDAGAVAARIGEDLAMFEIDGHEIAMTTSVGISVYPVDGEEPQVLLKQAGAALSHAKAHGRNQYQYYTEPLNLQARRRFSLESELRRAVDRGELHLQYQPQVELKTNRLVGSEALLRWSNDELGEISPGEFIPIAEETGLMSTITKWTLDEACRYLSRCHAEGVNDLDISVNISAVQFKEEGLARTLGDIVDAAGLEPRYVKLELTETALFDNMERAIKTLSELCEYGFEIEVDDFGTGYSSLNYLTRLPVGALKIDQSFVRKSTLSETDAAVVKVIIGLGFTLGYRIIAEGIESIEQFQFLAANGCDIGQGFVFSRPLSPEDFQGWATRWQKSHPGIPREVESQVHYLQRQVSGS